MNPPVFLSAVYDGSSVLVNWRAGDNPGITITGYTATVASSTGPNWPKTVTAFELAVSIATGALATAGVTYTVQVCAQASGQSPACTQQYLLITVQPALAHANYDGTSVELQWTPLPADAQITSYTASLFPAGGGFSQTATVEGPSASSTTIQLTQPLSGAYSVQITAKNTFAVGAATAPTAINTTTPSLLAATYNGASIIMSWAAPPQPAVAVNGYVLRAVSTDGGAPFSSTISNGALTNGSIAIPYPLDPSKTYSVFVTATTATPAASSCAPAAINTVQPRLTSISWNGTSLSATWQPIAYPSTPVASYQMIAFSASGGSPITSTISGPWASSGSMANPSFVSGLVYQLEISAQSANSIATYSDPVPIFTTRPAITAVTYDGAAVYVTWTPAQNAPAADAYQVTVSSSAGSYSTGVGGFAHSAVILLPSPLDIAATWSATVVASAGIANATSAAVPLQLTQASITIATYAGTTLALSWSIAQQPKQSYIRVVSSNGYGSYSSDAIQAPLTNGTIAFGSPLDPAGAYTLFIEAQYPSGITTRSTAEPLVGALPIVLSAAYDGKNVAVQWIPVTGSQPQLGGYQLKSYSNEGGSTSIVPIANASAAAGVVAGPPNASLPSIVQVCGIAGKVQSCSAQLALVQSSATVSTVTYDGANVRATWIPGTTSATAWIASIEQGGSAVASVTVTGTTAAIPSRLDLVHAYTLSVRAMAATIANGVARTSIGPAATNAIISAAPAIANVVTNSGSVVVTIDASGSAGGAGVQGYQASLWQGETNVATGTASDVSATSVTISYTLQPQFAYRVAVQAIGSSASSFAGPLTELVPVIAARPAITMTSISGTSATIAWTPATDPAVTGYSVVITQAGTAGKPIITTSAKLTTTIDPSKATTVAVAAIGSNATGLAGASATLVTETLTPSSATYDGTLLTMKWPAASTPCATYIAEVLSGGGVVARVAQSGTSASIPIALDGTATARVTVVAGNATGAPGSPLAVIATAPGVVSTSATGTNVTATIDTTTTRGLPGVSGWEAALFRNGDLVAGPVAATGHGDQVTAQIPTSAVSGSGLTIRARAIGAMSALQSGPYGNPASAILGGAAVEHIAYDGANFLVTWNAVSDPAVGAYQVTVGTAEVYVRGSATTIAIQLTANTSYTVGVTPMGANATGPPASMTFLVPGQVALLTASYDDANVGATWTAIGTGVSGYRMELYADSALVATTLVTGGASTGGTLPAMLAPGALAMMAVTAMNGSVAGPRSTTLPLIANAPSLIDVFYDGTNVNAAWTAVPGATQYELAVYQGSTKVTSQRFTGTSAVMPAALSGSGYQVIVRATAANTYGAWSAGVNPQSGPATFFLSSDNARVPYLYRSTYRPPLASALTSAAVTLYFPDLFTRNPPSTTPPAGALALESVENGGQIRSSITVASSVWTFDGTTNIRPALRSQFLAFIEWLEPALKPGATSFIARALSAGMPLSFAESLLYRYGFNPVSGYVDLVPGMKLRLDAEVYQLIPSSSPASLNGFVPSGSATYDITAATITGTGQRIINVAFDAFLSLLASTTVPVSQGGGSGVIDLYQPGSVKPYYRLFYPVTFPSAGVQGYSDASRNVALVGASSIAALEAATQTYLTQKNWNGIPSSNVSVAYFRGRMVALPRIVVVVDGVAQDVPVGTTLRQLIGSWANLPFAESLQVTSIAIERPTGGVVDAIAQAATTLDVTQNSPIRFATQTVVTYPDGEDWFDLPLFGADRISLGGS